MTDAVARCPRCGETKPLSEFYGDRTKASGRRSFCKVCDLVKSRAYYAANTDKVKARVSARARTHRVAYAPTKCLTCPTTFTPARHDQQRCRACRADGLSATRALERAA